jgi:hypothetical protein
VAVQYDAGSGGFTIVPDECPEGHPLYDTGCGAPGCDGWCCPECGTGCDVEFDPDGGQCATALDEESDDEYQARMAAERAAFGLSPLGP